MKKMVLCSWCINGIRSHGEKVYVGDQIDEGTCEFCDEDDAEECYFECVIEEEK